MRINAKSVFALLIAAITISTLGAAPASAFNSGDAVTYTQTITTPANPAANFSGSSGLDTWDIAVDDGKVYGIVHIDAWNNKIRITCNETSDGSACTNFPATIDGFSTFGTSPHTYIDPSTHYMWLVVKTGSTMETKNIFALCIDLADGTSCGDTSLGSVSINDNQIGENFSVGDKIYGVTLPRGSDGSNPKVFCYDVSESAACASQPFNLTTNAIVQGKFDLSNDADALDPTNGHALMKQIGSRFVGIYGGKLVCFDATTNAQCSGAWPVSETLETQTVRNYQQTAKYRETIFMTFIQHLDESNQVDGFCFIKVFSGVWVCRDFEGASLSVPSGLNDALSPVMDNQCVTITNYFGNGNDEEICNITRSFEVSSKFGSRVYLTWINNLFSAPNDITQSGGNLADIGGIVKCFDWETGEECAGFSRDLDGMSAPYLTYVDPANPACMWANGDRGDGQIQNFDVYTGGACGAAGSRILMSSFIEAGSTCAPTSYGTLKIVSPTNYTTAKVTLLDSNGESLGIAQKTFNGSREVDLSSLSLPTTSGSQPQMLIELKDGNGDLINAAIEARLSWDGTYDASCVASGQQASDIGSGGGNSGEITSADEVTVEEGELILLQNETDITDPTWSLDGGADEDLFTITAGGKLKFKTAQPVGDYVVVVKAKHGSTEATLTITVHVAAQVEVGSPAPATRENASNGKTKFTWASASNAVNYKVKLGKKVLCQSANLTCKTKGQWLSGKKIYVYAYASNGDKKRALTVPQDADPVAGDKVKLGMVHFDLDSIFIKINAVHKLDKIVKAIKQAGYTKIYVYGHTDNQGPAPHDISLSYRRARQVWMYLDKRIDNVKFVYKGFSRHEPAKPNSTEANLAFNRRVEIWAQ